MPNKTPLIVKYCPRNNLSYHSLFYSFQTDALLHRDFCCDYPSYTPPQHKDRNESKIIICTVKSLTYDANVPINYNSVRDYRGIIQDGPQVSFATTKISIVYLYQRWFCLSSQITEVPNRRVLGRTVVLCSCHLSNPGFVPTLPVLRVQALYIDRCIKNLWLILGSKTYKSLNCN